MAMKMRVSIIIPAYNEEKRIINAVVNYCNFFTDFEMLIINNGSNDRTISIIKELQAKYPQISLFGYPKLGKGGAIIEGLKLAKGEIIGFVDADEAVKAKDVKFLINFIEQGECDCVIASKWNDTPFLEVTEPFFRKIASRIWNLIVRILLGLNFSDTQAGAKFFTREVLEDIGTSFSCKGFEFDAELLWHVQKKGYLIKEVFISSQHQDESTFRLIDSGDMLYNILKLRIKG